MKSLDSKAVIYILFGSLDPMMSNLQSEIYSLTSSFSQLADSISYNLPTLGSCTSCQCSLKWLNHKVYQCMLKLQGKSTTKHWHCNICKRVITTSISVSNTSISLPLLQLRKILLQSQGGKKDLFMFHSGFAKRSFANKRKHKKVYSDI